MPKLSQNAVQSQNPKRRVGGAESSVSTEGPKKRGPKPRPIIEFPEPIASEWNDPVSFPDAFALQLKRHGDSCHHLHKAIVRATDVFDKKTLQSWANGTKLPNTVQSFDMLARIEHRYRLPAGYFRAKLPVGDRAISCRSTASLPVAERRRLAWHLPEDFDRRSVSEREEILCWVRTVLISGQTDYRRYQAEAMKTRYGLRFPSLIGTADRKSLADAMAPSDDADARLLLAPVQLARELADLVRFKTATLTQIGVKRSGVWGPETVSQKIEHLGLMFGALAGDPAPPLNGRGVARRYLTMALLVFPAVWDWYLQWREAKRGFYTSWEHNMLALGVALVRRDTGWLRQNPQFAQRLEAIPGLLTDEDIELARADWTGTCDRAYEHGLARSKEVARVSRVHRDPFEPILPILENDSPVGAYRRITAEILRRVPCEKRYPKAAAEAVRGFLMLRLGLHLGVRQKNLRQLLVCPRGEQPRTERQLETLRQGELRWSTRDEGWEVLIPPVAFKNANSSFFARQPFRLVLPDLDGLYDQIEHYIERLRLLLLGAAEDPGTFFVKTVKRTSKGAAYDQTTFYEAWRLLIQRYGIYNPYTGKGAIEGLLPHGPHNVRDVLATHILKRTGSYEQASYAIQDTPETVAQHYGRFLPQDKAAIAARVLNEVWSSA